MSDMYNSFRFDFARNALKYLIKQYDIKELYIPYYLCDVIRHSIVAEHCKPFFYHIDDNFMPTESFPENSYILYPNYFGICNNNINILANTYPKLIVDNAHACFNPPQGFACFNSERKFLPVQEGSTLWIKSSDIETKKLQITKRQTERIKVFTDLHERYHIINCLNIDISQITSPFCYPCLLKTESEADELAKNLTRNGKTIYRYWNPLPKSYNEYKFYKRLVPIPLA